MEKRLAKKGLKFHIIPEEKNDSASVTGALVIGANAPPFDYSALVMAQEERRVFFVGREPGQVVSWPTEPHPTEWQPVWAIPMRQRGRAIFCGTSISESEPMPLQSKCGDRRKLRAWKEVLWVRRKRIAPPEHRSLKTLWARFQEEASRV